MKNRWFAGARPQPEPEPGPSRSRRAALRRRVGSLYTRVPRVVLVAAGALIVLAAVLMYEGTRPAPLHITQRDIDAAVAQALASATPPPSYASQAYEVIRPSVVRIEAINVRPNGQTTSALGAGVDDNASGIILTSLHVVNGASEVHVFFADGTPSQATVIQSQPANDLAVLRADEIPDDLVPATLGNSGALSVGDDAFAVGNPFGLTGSLSAGVVSGLGRRFKSPETGGTLTGLIQFDAAVNPGNSGGPLVNRNGEVVGIVTALLNPTNDDVFVGVGFAVTIESAAAAAGPPWY